MSNPDLGPGVVHGSVAPGFERVRDEFAAVLAAEGVDLTAQAAAYHRGRKVVDLWSGPGATPDDLLAMYSAGKGVAHLVVALLVRDGVLDLEHTVSHYWPEFAVGGKDQLLLRELLSHQAGLVGARSGFSTAELADEHIVAERLGGQIPYWRPGRASGYHPLVMAALSGEVVRRATGRELGEHFTERLSGPYALDLHLGLPADQDHRFLTAQPMVSTPERLRELASEATAPDSLTGIAFNRHHPDNHEVWELPNLPIVRAKGPASFGGVGTARDLAKLYAALVSSVDDAPPLLSSGIAATFGQVQTCGVDLVLRKHKAWAVGFHPVSEIYPMLGAGAFGHSGAGGQQALVDPRNELSYAFLRRRACRPAQADIDHARLLGALLTSVRESG